MITLLAFAICSCEIHPLGTQAKLQALQRAARSHGRTKHHGTHTHAHAAAQGMSIVSPQWLSEYHSLESTHGDYVIPDDSRIQVSNDGKIKVPHSVVKHFNDLSQAPAKTEQPTP